MLRDGATWITLARQSCWRSASSGACDVEQHDTSRAAGIGKRQKPVGGKIGQDQHDAAFSQSGEHGHRVVVGADRRIRKLELLVR